MKCFVFMLWFVALGISPVCAGDAHSQLVPIESGSSIQISVLPKEEITTVFNNMKLRWDLALSPQNRTCPATAHKMAWLMEQRGIFAGKIMIRTEVDDSGLQWNFNVSFHENGKESWIELPGHMAVVVAEGTRDHYSLSVIDPILFDRPVSVEEWLHRMRKDSSITGVYQFTSRFVYNMDEEDSNPPAIWSHLSEADAALRQGVQSQISRFLHAGNVKP